MLDRGVGGTEVATEELEFERNLLTTLFFFSDMMTLALVRTTLSRDFSLVSYLFLSVRGSLILDKVWLWEDWNTGEEFRRGGEKSRESPCCVVDEVPCEGCEG